MPSYITDIATALPQYVYSADEIVSFLTATAKSSEAGRKASVVARKSGIRTRHSVIDDFRFPQHRELFNGHNPKVEERMRIYQKYALPLAINAVEKLKFFDPAAITHIITVSCTGMTAPGLELHLVKHFGLRKDSVKLAVNFIGCHGVFHALKTACSFTHQGANVLIVSVELCSLHFQPSDHDDSILANVLFGDGAAACVISARKPQGKGISLNTFGQHYIPDERGLMAWNIHSDGFLLQLSSYISDVLEQNMRGLFPDRSGSTLWAVHPGGKNILDAVERGLDLNDDALDISREVLSEVGNLSSATIMFVLEKLIARTNERAELCAMGFGPGLTIETLEGEIIT